MINGSSDSVSFNDAQSNLDFIDSLVGCYIDHCQGILDTSIMDWK